MDTGVKSRNVSYGSFACRLGFTECGLDTNSRV
jgi:hypothetical protein